MKTRNTSEAPRLVEIRLDSLLEPVKVGARRAALFMGLGLNGVAREDMTDYQLHPLERPSDVDAVPMDFIPADVGPQKLAEFKAEFSAWLIGAALRELMEHLALTLDRIHYAALFVLAQTNRTGAAKLGGDLDAIQKTFATRLGVPEKFEKLRKRFGITTVEHERAASLYRVRNCLTHSLGVVHAKAAADNGELKVQWAGWVTEARGVESQQSYSFAELRAAPLREDAQIVMRFVERERVFRVGERITFTHQELSEMCFFVSNRVAGTISESFTEFVRARGVRIDELRLPPDAVGETA